MRRIIATEVDSPKTYVRAKFASGGGWPSRVLVAHADPGLRAMMAEALRLDHHDVVEATSASAFLDQLGAYFVLGISGSPPDVIVSDTEIPGAAGFETLAALRDLDVRVPLVLVAEALDEELRAVTGARAVFVPPFDLDDLRTVVLNLVPDDGWLRTHTLP